MVLRGLYGGLGLRGLSGCELRVAYEGDVMRINSPEFAKWVTAFWRWRRPEASGDMPVNLVAALSDNNSAVRVIFDMGREYEERRTVSDVRQRFDPWDDSRLGNDDE